MIFNITTETGNVSLDRAQLLDMLLAEVLESSKAGPRSDMLGMSIALNEMLQQRGVYTQMTLDQTTLTAFSLGYYYNRFLEQNEVDITSTPQATNETQEGVNNDAETTSTNISEPNSEGSVSPSS